MKKNIVAGYIDNSSDGFNNYDALIKRNEALKTTMNSHGGSNLDFVIYSKKEIRPILKTQISDAFGFPINFIIHEDGETNLWFYDIFKQEGYFRIIRVETDITVDAEIPYDYFNISAEPFRVYKTYKKDISNLEEIRQFYLDFCAENKLSDLWDTECWLPDMRYSVVRPEYFMNNELFTKFQHAASIFMQSREINLDVDVLWLLVLHVLGMHTGLYYSKANPIGLMHLPPQGLIDPRLTTR